MPTRAQDVQNTPPPLNDDQLLKKYEYVPCWFLAMAWVGLDEGRRALDALEQAFRDHEPCMVSLKVDVIFNPLREEPRFKEMVRGVGLGR